MRLASWGRFFATAGDHDRALAQVRLARSHAEHLNLDYAAGGPLDAPLYMPAGACDSTNTVNSAGDACPSPSYTYRS